jgi:hypothetical protein
MFEACKYNMACLFGTSVKMSKTELGCFTVLVVCTHDKRSNLKPLSAARFAYLEKERIKTAKTYSVASSEDRTGCGSILVNKIRELATGAKCQFMTVDVTSHMDGISELIVLMLTVLWLHTLQNQLCLRDQHIVLF